MIEVSLWCEVNNMPIKLLTLRGRQMFYKEVDQLPGNRIRLPGNESVTPLHTFLGAVIMLAAQFYSVSDRVVPDGCAARHRTCMNYKIATISVDMDTLCIGRKHGNA